MLTGAETGKVFFASSQGTDWLSIKKVSPILKNTNVSVKQETQKAKNAI